MTQPVREFPVEFEAGAEEPRLDIVVPFTTPPLTQQALNAANRLGANLHVRIRLLRILVVPYPLDLGEPHVPISFLREQLEHFDSESPPECEIRLAREGSAGLLSRLHQGSLVVLSVKRRVWKTRNERLAAVIRRRGYTVILVTAEQEN